MCEYVPVAKCLVLEELVDVQDRVVECGHHFWRRVEQVLCSHLLLRANRLPVEGGHLRQREQGTQPIAAIADAEKNVVQMQMQMRMVYGDFNGWLAI